MNAKGSKAPGSIKQTLSRLSHNAGVFLLSLWLKSLRCRVQKNDETESASGESSEQNWNPSAGIPVLYTLWHQDLPAAMAAVKYRNIHVMISASSDGSLAAGCARSLGYQVVAGSGSRQPQALRHLLRALKHGFSAGMALDGPRGPRGKIFPGSAWLYQHSQCQAMQMQIEYGCALRINSWDRTRIPLPFSRVTLRLIPWNPVIHAVPGFLPE